MSVRILAMSAVDGSNNFTIQFSAAATHVDGGDEPIEINDDTGDNNNTALYVSGDGTNTLTYHVDGAAANYVSWAINDVNAWTFDGGGTLAGTTSGNLPYTTPPPVTNNGNCGLSIGLRIGL